MSYEVSIVSAFFDISRGQWEGDVGGHRVHAWLKRTNEQYLGWFANLGRLKNQLVIFTESKFADQVLDIRRGQGLELETVVIVCDGLFSDDGPLAEPLSDIKNAMRHELHRFVTDPALPEYWNASYVLLNALKSVFVCTAIDRKLIANEQIAWIDFGYCRDGKRFDPGAPWRFDCQDRMNIFYIREPDSRPIFDVVRTGDVYFQGCHLVGSPAAWYRFRDLIGEMMASLLDCGLVDDDQTMLLMAYRRAPEFFRIHAVSPDDWFVVLRDFSIRP